MRILTATVPCLCVPADIEDNPDLQHRLDRAVAQIRGPVFYHAGRATAVDPGRPVIRRAIAPLDAPERRYIWETLVNAMLSRLDSADTALTGELTALANDFHVGARRALRVCLDAEAALSATLPPVDGRALAATLRIGCAESVRARLDPLAERISLEPLPELALPEREARQFSELELTIRLAHQVGVDWGLGRGRAVAPTALFAGPSGTGKTHAAYVLSRRLGLDLYRIDLAGVLSKYIGDTEKNLERIFDAASLGGVVLLFDEADALFGKRSEVRDSHDRYANLSTAYLLSRIERTPAPAILTTNMKDAIDPAFARRLSFVIDFPFPAEEQRAEIWRQVFPAQAPVAELAPERLALMAATGGTITNIARRGAYLAAAQHAPIDMDHLREASRHELRKLGRELAPEERAAWHMTD